MAAVKPGEVTAAAAVLTFPHPLHPALASHPTPATPAHELWDRLGEKKQEGRPKRRCSGELQSEAGLSQAGHPVHSASTSLQ